MSYVIQKHLTKINKGKKGDNKPEYVIIHFVGATGQAMDNAEYFNTVYRGASAQYFIDPKTIVQVVEDDTPAWHIGDGSRTKKGNINGYVHPGGATNVNSIGIELCQDVTTGKDVWHWDFHPETIKRAEWLVKKLQKQYNISDDRVIRHFDATGKVCPGNWQHDKWAKWWEFKKRLEKGIVQPTPTFRDNVDEGKLPDSNMYLVEAGDTLFAIAKKHNITVAQLITWNDLSNPSLIFPETKLYVTDPNIKNYPAVTDIEQMARDVLAGKYGNGEERKKKLGDHYNAVQAVINGILLGKSNPPSQPTPVVKIVSPIVTPKPTPVVSSATKTINQLADEVIRGLHGSGRERMISLGSNYTKVQQEVNRRLRQK